MEPLFPSPVKTWHNDTYPAISPTRPELRATGKTIVITGAGGVIGRETAVAFALAGAKHIALVGRTVASLEETKAALPKTTEASTHRADITNAEQMQDVARTIGAWDVLILCAAHMPGPGHIATADIGSFWSAFEAFVQSANPEKAVILGLFSGAMCFPAQATGGLSSYLVSKMAQAKLLEYVAVENGHIFTASIHPGMVDSPLFRASGATPETLPMDAACLSAHFILWMASPEANDLRGKLVWANWDVEELKAVAARVENGPKFTVGTIGWPFSVAEGSS